jgi:hypothetical protein
MKRKEHQTAARALDDRDAEADVFTAPHAIVRGADGRSRWVALCPRCAKEQQEAVVTGDEEHARATCGTCGAIVEVRVSGVYRVAPTVRPKAE